SDLEQRGIPLAAARPCPDVSCREQDDADTADRAALTTRFDATSSQHTEAVAFPAERREPPQPLLARAVVLELLSRLAVEGAVVGHVRDAAVQHHPLARPESGQHLLLQELRDRPRLAL